MALVSEELGMKEADSTSTFLKQLMILLAQAMRDGRQKGYTDEHMKGAKAIYRHIHFGGKVSYQVVSTEDAALFEKILQNRRVPYVRLAETDGKTTIVTRDKDKKQVEKAWELLAQELKIAFKELAPQEFIQDNAGKNICHTAGYSEVELEVFRKEGASLGFAYAVIGNEKENGKYDILYSETDKEIVTRALKGLEYELSGEEGLAYRQKLEQSLAVKNHILQEAKEKEKSKEIMYIVNANNPMEFITLGNGVVIEHKLSVEEKTKRDGSKVQVVRDKARKTQPFGNRELTIAMKKLGKCKLVPEERMNFVKNFDSAGNVQVPDVEELRMALQNVESCTGPVFELTFGRAELLHGEKLLTISDLDGTEAMELTNALQKEGIAFTAVNGDIAYREQDREQVDTVLDETICKGMPYLNKVQMKMKLEGRCPENMNLQTMPEPVYFTSASNPDYMLKVDMQGLVVLKNGEAVMSMERTSPDFEDNLIMMFDSMENMVAITETEAGRSPQEKVKLIEERSGVKENQATVQYKLSYTEQKERFLNTEYNSLEEEEKKLVQKFMAHETKTAFVDRSYAVKMSEKDYGTRMKEQKTEKKRSSKKVREQVDR